MESRIGLGCRLLSAGISRLLRMGFALVVEGGGGSLRLEQSRRQSSNTITSVFYTVLFLNNMTAVSVTMYNYPLFPFQTDSLEWCRTWLVTTVLDYYGACLCFCGVVLASEDSWSRGLAWVAGFCLLGPPVCCVWILLWLWRGGGSLRLEQSRRNQKNL